MPRSVLVGFGPGRPLASVGSFADHLERADRAGFDEVIFYWPHEDPENRFWADPDVVAEAVTAARR